MLEASSCVTLHLLAAIVQHIHTHTLRPKTIVASLWIAEPHTVSSVSNSGDYAVMSYTS